MSTISDMFKTLEISAAGMKAQSSRLRVIGENIANASSTAKEAGGDPYRRKLITFENTLDKMLGINKVRVAGYSYDTAEFGKRFDPSHPSAGEDGFLLLPNVNALIEMADMREALRSYEANLSVVEASKSMLQKTIDLLSS